MEGTVKDPAPLNNLVKASCDSGKVEDRELVLQVYQDIIAKTGAAFVGNSFTAMVLIGSYRSNNDFDAVVGLHRAMVDAGVEVWLPAASNVMFAYAKVSNSFSFSLERSSLQIVVLMHVNIRSIVALL